jgi:hypothetical protein
MTNIKYSHLMCNKNLFFCDFFGLRLGGTSNIIDREHNISSLFKSHTSLNQPHSSVKWHIREGKSPNDKKICILY